MIGGGKLIAVAKSMSAPAQKGADKQRPEKRKPSESFHADARQPLTKQGRQSLEVPSGQNRHSFALNAPIVDKFRLGKSIDSQFGEVKVRLSRAALAAFEKKVPLVVAARGNNLVVGFEELLKRYSAMLGDEELTGAVEERAWEKAFAGFSFCHFIDATSGPLILDSFADIRREGIFSSTLLTRLLFVEYAPQESWLLLSFLARQGAFGAKKELIEGMLLAKSESSKEHDDKKELLFDAFTASDARLTEYLLELGVSPNSFDASSGMYAINGCEIFVKDIHRAALLRHGADASLNPEEPAYVKELYWSFN